MNISTFRHRQAAHHVRHRRINADEHFSGSRRIGTVIATRQLLERSFGPPDPVDSFDGKVKMRWVFDTPRGPVTLYDYWWNAPGEWSIGGFTGKAVRWFRRFLEVKCPSAATSNAVAAWDISNQRRKA